MTRLRLLALLTGILSLLCSGRSLAQQEAIDTAGDPPGYREAIAGAIEEFNARNYEEAREQFAAAHRLFPNARTLRGLGLTGFELRHYPEAVMYLRQALESDVRPLEGDVRTSTEVLLGRAEGYTGTVKLDLEPAGVAVLVDGERRDYIPSESLYLPVGDHTFEFRATGRASERRTVTVVGREVQSLRLSLAKLESGGGFANGERKPGATPVYKKWWLWTSIGAVVVGGAVAGILLARRETRYEPRTTENTPSGVNALSPMVRFP
jgi:hypothetical protein